MTPSQRGKIIGLASGAAVGLLLLAWLAGSRTHVDTSGIFGGKTASVPSTDTGLPVLADAMPEFQGIASWLNSAPLVAADLRGKVVLIDFWTYSCINCIRTLPAVKGWNARYKDEGLAVIGVHTPEFAFEKDEGNVRDALKRFDITYPVALDNDYGTWNAYENHYWPAKYLFDGQGRLRYLHFGEGSEEETENNIRALLAELGQDVGDAKADGKEQVADFAKIGTPETYVGYARAAGFGSPEEVKRDAATTYSIPADLAGKVFALGGAWTIAAESATAENAGDALALRYSSSSANLVAGAATPVTAEITLDGAPVPATMLGADAFSQDGKTYVKFSEERLYNLVDAKGNYGEHVLRLQFRTRGIKAYAFTFG